MNLEQEFERQQFSNGYELVDGVKINTEVGDQFQIPHPIFKRNVGVSHFVELRIDSPRFSAHADAPVDCTCPHCNQPATKPILGHEQPASLLKIPRQNVPSRGWGEDFWVRVTARNGDYLAGIIDNPLYESRLHGLDEGDHLLFREHHILSIHRIHNEEILLRMNPADFEEIGRWIGSRENRKGRDL